MLLGGVVDVVISQRLLQVRLRQGLAQGERRPLLHPLQVPPQQDARRHKGPIFPLSLSLSLVSY